MIKLYRFHTRTLDSTHEQAVQDWTGRHAAVIVDALGEHLVRYATNVAIPVSWGGEPREAPPYDGFDELWLDLAWEEVRPVFDAAPAVAASERRFAGTTLPMAADEVVQKATGVPHTFKLVELLVRRRDMTWEQSRELWLNQHAPFVKETWGDAIVHYTTNLGLWNPFTMRFPEEAPPYDGVAEIYWSTTLDEFRQGLVDTADAMIPDETAFLGTYRGLLVEEKIVLQRDA